MDRVESVDGRRLAAALAERLKAIAPPDAQVLVSDGRIVFALKGAGYASESNISSLVEGRTGDPAEAIWLAASDAINSFHDYICEASTEPWPIALVSGGKREIANPGTALQGDRVKMWFGEADSPVLVLQDLVVEEFVLP